ncbi:hypothetical protein Tco_0957560 [Tanacetum coccineum]
MRKMWLGKVYVEALLKRFCNTYEDPLSDLKNIRQKGLQIYIDAFDLLMTKVELPETQAISFHLECSGRLFSLEMVEDSRDYEDETEVQCNEGVFGYEDKEVEMETGEPNEGIL